MRRGDPDLHFHRFQYDQRLTLYHTIAFCDQDVDDLSGHRRCQRIIAAPGQAFSPRCAARINFSQRINVRVESHVSPRAVLSEISTVALLIDCEGYAVLVLAVDLYAVSAIPN